jgi:hypothetical protein
VNRDLSIAVINHFQKVRAEETLDLSYNQKRWVAILFYRGIVVSAVALDENENELAADTRRASRTSHSILPANKLATRHSLLTGIA